MVRIMEADFLETAKRITGRRGGCGGLKDQKWSRCEIPPNECSYCVLQQYTNKIMCSLSFLFSWHWRIGELEAGALSVSVSLPFCCPHLSVSCLYLLSTSAHTLGQCHQNLCIKAFGTNLRVLIFINCTLLLTVGIFSKYILVSYVCILKYIMYKIGIEMEIRKRWGKNKYEL